MKKLFVQIFFIVNRKQTIGRENTEYVPALIIGDSDSDSDRDIKYLNSKKFVKFNFTANYFSRIKNSGINTLLILSQASRVNAGLDVAKSFARLHAVLGEKIIYLLWTQQAAPHRGKSFPEVSVTGTF